MNEENQNLTPAAAKKSKVEISIRERYMRSAANEREQAIRMLTQAQEIEEIVRSLSDEDLVKYEKLSNVYCCL